MCYCVFYLKNSILIFVLLCRKKQRSKQKQLLKKSLFHCLLFVSHILCSVLFNQAFSLTTHLKMFQMLLLNSLPPNLVVTSQLPSNVTYYQHLTTPFFMIHLHMVSTGLFFLLSHWLFLYSFLICVFISSFVP